MSMIYCTTCFSTCFGNVSDFIISIYNISKMRFYFIYNLHFNCLFKYFWQGHSFLLVFFPDLVGCAE